jgi:predicted HAD superfamily Cof-like phosphohydrolase
MSYFKDVGEFHLRFNLPFQGEVRDYYKHMVVTTHFPHLIGIEEVEFRNRFLAEEVRELGDAQARGDLVGIADALVDIVYVALGTAHYYGVPFDEVWAKVHRANLRKERATDAADARSVRGSALDVVKPEGWEPPDVEGVLVAHGFPW